ncbi:SpoIIE family protein phosphatase [Gemmatimonadota bacterium]
MLFQEDLSIAGSLLDNLTEGIIIADAGGRLRYFNTVAEDILGIGVQEVSPDEWTVTYGCFYPDRITPYPPEELPLARAIKGEEVRDVLLYIENPERPEGVFIKVSGSPVRNGSDTLIGGSITIRNVTENINREAVIRRLSNAVEQTADAVIITDRHAIIEYVNPAFETTTGYPLEEVIGKKPGILRSGHHDDRFYKAMWDTLRQGKSYHGNVLNRRKDGEFYWSQQTITPMKDSNGEVTNFVAVARDITDFIERERFETRIQVAREIQQRLYKESITVPGYDIAGASFPAEETNGDYYDFIRTPDGRVWLILGDVCSHGLGSALIMTQTRAFIHALAMAGHEPGDVLSRLNEELVSDLDPLHYVTLLLVRVYPEMRFMEYVSAGHPSGYVVNRSGEVLHELPSIRVPLGFLPDQNYPMSEPIRLDHGDSIVLLSDGVIETCNSDDVLFGPEGVHKVLQEECARSSSEIVEQLHAAARAHAAGRLQDDDISALVCKVGDAHDEQPSGARS